LASGRGGDIRAIVSGRGGTLASQVVVGPVMASDWWYAFAGAMAALG
jgi:hypothetical protein